MTWFAVNTVGTVLAEKLLLGDIAEFDEIFYKHYYLWVEDDYDDFRPWFYEEYGEYFVEDDWKVKKIDYDLFADFHDQIHRVSLEESDEFNEKRKEYLRLLTPLCWLADMGHNIYLISDSAVYSNSNK